MIELYRLRYVNTNVQDSLGGALELNVDGTLPLHELLGMRSTDDGTHNSGIRAP